MFHRIAILGLGLIGGSLARALAQRHPHLHIAAFDLSHEALEYAMEHRFIHSRHASAGEAVAKADLVVFCTPSGSFAALATAIVPFLKEGSIVTDVASVKRSAIAAIASSLPGHACFVPGHPIAGSEKTGVAAADAELFKGKRVLLTPREEELLSPSVAQVCALWESVGARVEFMPADLHDRIYAYVSHLPQLVAFAAWHSLKNFPAGNSDTYVRFTRLAASSPALWADICLANADSVAEALGDFITFLSQITGELSENGEGGEEDSVAAAALFPKIIATCLIATASQLQETTGIHPARYAGTGFADMTSPAIDNAESALAALSTHHRTVARMLRDVLARLDATRKAIALQDRNSLMNRFKEKKD